WPTMPPADVGSEFIARRRQNCRCAISALLRFSDSHGHGTDAIIADGPNSAGSGAETNGGTPVPWVPRFRMVRRSKRESLEPVQSVPEPRNPGTPEPSLTESFQ